MATCQVIAPFPENIDRDHFGSWLSGFTDGEGCFYLQFWKKHYKECNKTYRRPDARFIIGLRSDDQNCLYLIQSYWQCGTVGTKKSRYREGLERAQQTMFHLNSDKGRHIVIDHFTRYPLIAKKSRDFLIWKEAALLINKVIHRKRVQLGHRRGIGAQWTPKDIQEFQTLHDELRRIRHFTHVPKTPVLPAPRPILETQLSLWERVPELAPASASAHP